MPAFLTCCLLAAPWLLVIALMALFVLSFNSLGRAWSAPKEEGEYEYVCTLPGHYVLMWGKLIVTKDVDAYLAAHPLSGTAAVNGAHPHK